MHIALKFGLPSPENTKNLANYQLYTDLAMRISMVTNQLTLRIILRTGNPYPPYKKIGGSLY